MCVVRNFENGIRMMQGDENIMYLEKIRQVTL